MKVFKFIFFLKIKQTSSALVVAVVVAAEPTVEAGAGGVGDLDDTRGWRVSLWKSRAMTASLSCL